MGTVLVFVQHDSSGKIAKGSLAALTAARQLKEVWGHSAVSAVALGPGAVAAASSVAALGVESAFFSEDSIFTDYRAEPYARGVMVAARAAGASVIVGLASSSGKDFLPRVAMFLDAGQASDVIGVNADGSLKRPMYAGNILADVEIVCENKVISVRGTAFPVAGQEGGAGAVVALPISDDAELVENERFGQVVSREQTKADRPELADAEIVVSGGRALASAENFEKVMFPLADAFNAAVGASRAAVDSGYAPNDWQVGQTGKVVAPALYVAVGVSGAIQHLAGMKDSKCIVAINKDPDAPIFEVADYGLVADLFQAVPELTEAVKRTKA